jgi:cell division septation protein DedD
MRSSKFFPKPIREKSAWLGVITLDEIMITPGFDNFFFIAGGAVPPNPADLIDSQRIDQFIGEAKEEYDMILFDTAPILSAVDPAILATKVDGVLLVYRIGTVPKGLLKRAITQLGQVKANVIGVILNGMRPEVSPDFEDYKHYKYYYSYGEDGQRTRKKKQPALFDTKKVDLTSLGLTSPSKAAGRVGKGWRKWEKTLGIPLLILAGLLVAGGLLWQNNILGPFKSSSTESPGSRQELKIPIESKPPSAAPPAADLAENKSAAREEPKDLPVKSEPAQQATVEDKGEEAAEIQKEPPVETSRGGVVEKQEQKPPAEEPKVEQKIEAKKAPAAKEKPKAEPTTARSSSGVHYPISLFLGSVPHLDQAEQGVSRYRKNGVPVYYTEVALSKGIWYRLYAGTFETEEAAQKFKEEKGFGEAEVKETPFAKLIGVFTSKDKLEGKIQSLKGLGFSPYVIKEADGKQRLVVGAFYNEERARRQHEELKSKGIENEIVER